MPQIGGLNNSSGFGSFVSATAPAVNNFGDWLNNAFTGNIDFDRQNYLFQQQVKANNAVAAADRSFQASENQKNRDFQADQTSTEYLRAADQLRQLGINPAVLAYGNASTASYASGSASSAGSHHVSGSSWTRSRSDALGSVLKLAGTLVNVAAFALG